jgi:hypothetical protein
MDDSLDEFYNKYHFNLILLFGVIIVIYIGIFSLFNNLTFNTPEARPWILMIELIMWGLFILILYMNMKYFSVFDIDFHQMLYNLFGTKRTEMEIHVHRPNDASNNKVTPRRDVSGNPTPTHKKDVSCNPIATPGIDRGCLPIVGGEVFHIPSNKYGYEEAKEVCKLFDARLATYDEVEDSYKNGANWCSYGWSNDQLALFPIQKSTYNELKKIPGHEHDCGRTGVNGGYIENKDIKFGVNCYGKKPYAGDDDLAYMDKVSYSNAYPDAELKLKEKEEKMKKILISSFNKEKWNEF